MEIKQEKKGLFEIELNVEGYEKATLHFDTQSVAMYKRVSRFMTSARNLADEYGKKLTAKKDERNMESLGLVWLEFLGKQGDIYTGFITEAIHDKKELEELPFKLEDLSLDVLGRMYKEVVTALAEGVVKKLGEGKYGEEREDV